MTYSDAKGLVLRGLGILVLIAAATYGADYLWLRLRLGGSNQNSALGSVTVYEAVTLKNGKVEVFYDHPETETCVYAMFPHLGYAPCWYLQRKGQNIKQISLLARPNLRVRERRDSLPDLRAPNDRARRLLPGVAALRPAVASRNPRVFSAGSARGSLHWLKTTAGALNPPDTTRLFQYLRTIRS